MLLLYAGQLMTYEQIDDWKMEEGKSVFLLGFTSATESIEHAIKNIHNIKANTLLEDE